MDPTEQSICYGKTAEIAYKDVIGEIETYVGLTIDETNKKFTTEALTTTTTYTISVSNVTCTAQNFTSKVNVYDEFNPGDIVIESKTICQTETSDLTIGAGTVASGGDNNYTYQWYVGTEAISGANSATYTIPVTYTDVPGTYVFTRKAKDGTCQGEFIGGGILTL